MIHSGHFADKKILIVDKDEKKKNDRTWSFWETTPGLFESIVYHRWKKTWFHCNEFSRLLELSPYEYKMIRGIDFYEYCFSVIRQHPAFEICFGEIESVSNKNGQAVIYINDEEIQASFIFSSIIFEKPVLKRNEHYLLQHFKGWIIETENPCFKEDEATLMDFRANQQHGTAFTYVKPFSATKALVEYTLFTDSLLENDQYKKGLTDYISKFIKTGEYKIIEEENGVIPMTNYRFATADGCIIYIGTAGGQTKPSSGYTFKFIQKHSADIVQSLIKKEKPFIDKPVTARRFRFYDSTLLYILKHQKVAGDEIFSRLFKKNKPPQVLKFLDNESSFGEELKIISSLPTWPFLKAAVKQL